MATAFPGQAVHPTQSNFRRTPAAKPPTTSLPPPNLSRNRNSPARAHHRYVKWALRLSLVDRQTPTHERPAVEVDELVKFLYADLPHLFDEQGIDRTMYDDEVKFRDPITKHDTISGYLFNILLLRKLFSPDFQLHSVKQTGPYEITTRWTMVMKFALLPWKPELVFTGLSIMGINPETKKFCSHLDLWDSIKKNDYFSIEGLWDVIRQLRIYKTPDLETPEYRILKRTADYEIREYSPFVVVETKGDKLAGSKGFNDVAGYIFGKNSSEEKIPMTTPVFTQAFDPDRSNISIQIVLPLEKDFGSLSQMGAETQWGNQNSLQMQNSDNPGMVLVTSVLTGNNYQAWSRAMKIALGAKFKTAFITGELPTPTTDSATYDQWKRCDFMVTSWILNSISKELSEAFLYTNSSRELWLEIEQRFGESNGPLIYQLQREISLLSQGTDSISTYFTKLKKLWDELSCVSAIPTCHCNAAKAQVDHDSVNKLMQFLMGLQDDFEPVRNQILLLDPLPSVVKAYSMIQRVAKQRQISHTSILSEHNSVCSVRSQSSSKGSFGRNDRPRRHCDHCNRDGHTKEFCYKLHGFPDKKGKGKGTPSRVIANVTAQDTPLDNDDAPKDYNQLSNAIVQTLQQWMLHNQRKVDPPSTGFAGVVNKISDESGPSKELHSSASAYTFIGPED